jgi:hypothetical protein
VLFTKDHGAAVAALHGLKRSPDWSRAKKAHLAKQANCIACVAQPKGLARVVTHLFRPVDVHHIIPLHVCGVIGLPRLELDARNLVTLCGAHHLVLGHLGDYASYNPVVKFHVIRFFGKTLDVVLADVDYARFVQERPREISLWTPDEKAVLRAKLEEKFPA